MPSGNCDRHWIRALLRAHAYPHPTEQLRLVETHISWVILTGPFAYKIKKPVDLGFLDFSTPERRRHFCEEEVRLNRRLAPALYLDVLPITGSRRRPQIGGTGPALDYAVRMRQFGPDALLSERAAGGRLETGCIDRLAESLAAFHREALPAPSDSRWGNPDAVASAIDENLAFLGRFAASADERAPITEIARWTEDQFHCLSDSIAARRAAGFVRECHGDLHLGNLALIEAVAVPFDCIEFNPELRWIDIISEVAFLTMDLEAHGLRPLAYRFMNRYQEIVGDYAGLTLWSFYRCYRAMVRAKVARLTQATTSGDSPGERPETAYRRYIACGLGFIEPARPFLAITHGPSGSGKSTVAAQLAEHPGAIRLRSDVERKRNAEPSTFSDPEIYSAEATQRTYSRLAELSAPLIRSGLSVIVDATFLDAGLRRRQRSLARELGVPFWILDVDTPDDIMRERVVARRRAALDPSDATLEVLEQQLRTREPLTDEEGPHVLRPGASAASRDAALAALAGSPRV